MLLQCLFHNTFHKNIDNLIFLYKYFYNKKNLLTVIVIQTENDFNRRITECFAIGSNSPCVPVSEFDSSYTGTVVSYGILRGTGEILKNSKSFYYIDHGYFGSVQRKFKEGKTVIQSLSGYFRIVKNDLIHDGNGQYDKKRIGTRASDLGIIV